MSTRRACILGAIVVGLLLALSPRVRHAGQALSAAPEPQAQAPQASPFRAIDIFIDTGDSPLAAYQFEFWAEGDGVKLVGIEGGEHAAFSEPPYYDPRALSLPQPRAIIAAFNTGTDLPTGRTRIARLMLHVSGPDAPQYHSRLQVAATSDATPIAGAELTISEGANP